MTDQNIIQKIEEVLEQIRPNIQMDGGEIEFVRFENGIVYVRLLGACVGCPASMYTLKLGVEEALRERLADVREVVAVEDEY
jgi:Fe-S cluster biogenesis protein NfuA